MNTPHQIVYPFGIGGGAVDRVNALMTTPQFLHVLESRQQQDIKFELALEVITERRNVLQALAAAERDPSHYSELESIVRDEAVLRGLDKKNESIRALVTQIYFPNINLQGEPDGHSLTNLMSSPTFGLILNLRKDCLKFNVALDVVREIKRTILAAALQDNMFQEYAMIVEDEEFLVEHTASTLRLDLVHRAAMDDYIPSLMPKLPAGRIQPESPHSLPVCVPGPSSTFPIYDPLMPAAACRPPPIRALALNPVQQFVSIQPESPHSLPVCVPGPSSTLPIYGLMPAAACRPPPIRALAKNPVQQFPVRKASKRPGPLAVNPVGKQVGKPRRARLPWSLDDTRKVIKGVAQFGQRWNKWKLIKDNMFSEDIDRTEQDIRDKWLNLISATMPESVRKGATAELTGDDWDLINELKEMLED
ncbi:unnamed protein product [Linum trigynum]|uniref:Myb-like domain-containing protein n=1 Tax=Linum trigynum TaxID=586398 RepID=A0AAV2G4R7_9ROSI